MALSRIMCFGSSNKDKEGPDAKRSRDIEKQLREDQKRMAREVKLLLLGITHYASLTSIGPSHMLI